MGDKQTYEDGYRDGQRASVVMRAYLLFLLGIAVFGVLMLSQCLIPGWLLIPLAYFVLVATTIVALVIYRTKGFKP